MEPLGRERPTSSFALDTRIQDRSASPAREDPHGRDAW
jgi:hypothetical protein